MRVGCVRVHAFDSVLVQNLLVPLSVFPGSLVLQVGFGGCIGSIFVRAGI